MNHISVKETSKESSEFKASGDELTLVLKKREGNSCAERNVELITIVSYDELKMPQFKGTEDVPHLY